MKTAILILAAMIMIGCSKGGTASHFTDGAPVTDPTIVDRNLPGPDGNPAP